MKTSLRCPGTGHGLEQSSHWMATAQRGFTLIEILIVVAVIGVMSAIAVPSYVKARTSTQVKGCITNLQKIYGAKGQWAIENRKRDTDIPTAAEIAAYLNGNKMPSCPGGGTYRPRRVARVPACTLYAVGHTMNNSNMDDDAAPD